MTVSRTWRCRRTSRGFTLIEMLVATVLAAMLMVLVAGVLRSMNRQNRWVSNLVVRHPAVLLLRRQLECDLYNARTLVARNGQIRIHGLLAEGGPDRLLLHRPADVVYELRSISGNRCLVRTLLQTGRTGVTIRRRQIVWRGVERMEFQAFQITDPAESPEAAIPNQNGRSVSDGKLPPMPARIEWQLFDNRDGLLCQVTYVR